MTVTRADEDVWQAAVGQERHWAYHRRFPRAAGFNIPIASRIRGPLDAGRLVAAVHAVAQRHESLRATFRPTDSGLLQVLHGADSVPVEVHDLRRLPEPERAEELRRIGDAEASRPFDLASEVPLRVHVVQLGPEDHVLVVNVHHIAFDGWSSRVFYMDLDAQYRRLATSARIDEPAQRYVDFARWQRRQVAAGRYQAELDYWLRELAEPAPALPWPQDGVDPAAEWWAGDMVWLDVPERLVAAAQQTALQWRTTLFVVGLSAYQLALHRVTQASHVAVGTALGGRTDRRWEDVVGFFVNTAVLDSRSSLDLTFREIVAANHRRALGALSHQLVPFGVVVDELSAPAAPGRTPLFQTMFLLQNYPPAMHRLGEADIHGGKLVTGSTRYDLTFSLDTLDGRLALELENRPHLVSQDTAITVAREFFAVLGAGIDSPAEPVSRLRTRPVETTVHQRRGPASAVDELFGGLVADWR